MSLMLVRSKKQNCPGGHQPSQMPLSKNVVPHPGGWVVVVTVVVVVVVVVVTDVVVIDVVVIGRQAQVSTPGDESKPQYSPGGHHPPQAMRLTTRHGSVVVVVGSMQSHPWNRGMHSVPNGQTPLQAGPDAPHVG
jgi:hypothetical protein